MSRTNTVDEITVETTVDKSSAAKIVTSPTKKITVDKFLQLHPQSYIVAQMMRSLYKGKVMTEDEWLKLLEDTLNSKV